MIDLLRDPAWQFVGVILATFALITTVAIYIFQRQRKRIAFEIISKNQLLTVREELEGKLQVLYDGQPTSDIRLLVIKITNVGNLAIATADYEKELSFSTGISSKILSVAVTDVDPANINIEIERKDTKFSIMPALLNPKDSITIKCLISDYSDQLIADGRIIGVRKIENLGSSTNYQIVLAALSMLVTFIGFYLILKFSPTPEIRPPKPIEVKIGTFLFAIGYIGLLSFLFIRNSIQKIVRSLTKSS